MRAVGMALICLGVFCLIQSGAEGLFATAAVIFIGVGGSMYGGDEWR